jgi:putative transposase
VTQDDEEQRRRAERARQAGLFRYGLIQDVIDPLLSAAQRGALVRELAGREHDGPSGARTRVSEQTIRRWIRAWRAGGFQALVPAPARVTPRTPAEVLALAVALKRENPRRTAVQVTRILRAQAGWAPSDRTLRRHFARLELDREIEGAPQVFGRFEASRCNEIWTGDALHGPVITGRKTYLFAFLDDRSRAVMAARFGFSEDTVRLAAALRPALASRGVPESIYVLVLDTPAGSAVCPATCRNAAPAGSLTFQAQPEIVRQRLHNPGDRKVCRGRWESSPGHVRPAGLARRAARPGCLPGGVHRGLPGIPGRPWLQPADHRQRRGDS